MQHKRLAMVMTMVAVLAVAGVLILQWVRPPALPPEKVTVAHSMLPYAALAQIAQAKGLFRQEGLDATPLLYPYGKLALEAVIAGKADFATVAETPVVLSIMNGADLAILATIDLSKRSHAIVARRDRGIGTPQQLKGKRIGAIYGTSGDFYLDAFLSGNGIGLKEVEEVYLKPEELAHAFMNGAIEAASVFPPFLTQLQKAAGSNGVTFYDDDVYTLTFNLVTTKEFARRNPQKVKKMLRALLAAEEFTRRNQRQARQVVARFSGMDPAEVEDIWPDNQFLLTLDQGLLLAMEDESLWAMKSGLTNRRQMPNYLDYIDLEGLLSVKPKAVNIVK